MTGRNHDEIRSILPEFRSGSLDAGMSRSVEEHLRECGECRQALAGIEALAGIAVPDPGDFYWRALPLRVRAAALEPKEPRFSWAFLFRWSVPAAAGLVAILAFALWPGGGRPAWDPLFHDPLAAPILEYRHLAEKDIPYLIESGDDGRALTGHENLTGYSYLREVVSLSEEELRGLGEALERQRQKGGAS